MTLGYLATISLRILDGLAWYILVTELRTGIVQQRRTSCDMVYAVVLTCPDDRRSHDDDLLEFFWLLRCLRCLR